MNLLAEPIERGPLRVSSPAAGGVLMLSGTLRERDPAAWLCALIDDVHARAKNAHLATVTLDLRQLEYANAAAWRCIVYWIRLVRDPACHYRLRILGEETHSWQKVGMASLSVFASDRLEVVMSSAK